MNTKLNAARVASLSLLVSGPIVHVPGVAQTMDEALARTGQSPDKAATSCRAVRAAGGWRGAGMMVNPDQFVCVAADGLWSHGIQGIQAITPYYGPEGFAEVDRVNVPEVVSRVGALVGRIGGNPPFVIGKQLCFIPSTAGQLMLSMNDDPGASGNNAGFLRVAIAAWPASASPDRVHMHPPSCRAR